VFDNTVNFYEEFDMKSDDWDAIIGYISVIGICVICIMLIVGCL
jgi:hypothetical protein